MKVFIDTNVLFSAVLFPGSIPYRAYLKTKTRSGGYHGIICQQVLNELRRTFNKKFPDRMSSLNKFLSEALVSLEIVMIPEKEHELEKKVRDLDDRIILRAAINAEVDMLLTGDKDLLEAGIDKPRIITPAEFVYKY